MFTIKKLIVLSAAVAICGVAPADAKTKTQGSGKAIRPPSKNNYGVSTTLGWRKIGGWQDSLTKRNPNLKKWNWSAMQEMDKGYMRFKPGQTDSRKSHYVKPVHESFSPHSQVASRPTSAPSGSHYVRPVQVPLPTPNREVFARLSAPRQSPATSLSYSVPRSNPPVVKPSTNIRWAAPQPVSKPQVSSNTSAKLRKPPASDAMSNPGATNVADSFESPETESNPYGPVTHHNYGYTHKTTENVKAKVIKKRTR